MPSGGGAAGGGGGGGGGGGVGGGGGGGVGGGGGGGAYYGRHSKGQDLCSCTVGWTIGIVVIVVTLAILLPIILTGRLNKSDVNIATDFYSPGDSRLHVFSSFFCENINIEVNSNKTGATLALVDSTPPLTDKNSFNILDQRILRDRMFQFWQYHLYPGSNISIDVCINGRKNRVLTYLIKGNSNVNIWRQNLARTVVVPPIEAFRSVTESCPEQSSIKYTVTEEDEYYVLLYNARQGSGTDVSYSAILWYERFEYALPDHNTPEQLGSFCSAPSRGQCIVEIPYGTGSQQALVVTTIPEDVDWGENVDVNVSCNRRGWAYAVVILLPLLAVTAIVVSIVTGVCLYCHKYKSRKRSNHS